MALYPGERYDEQAFQQPPAATAAPPAQAAQPAAGPETQAMPAGQEPSYGLKHAIVDAVAQKLGFGTPIRNVETMRFAEDTRRMIAEEHNREMAVKQQEQQVKDVARHTAGYFLAVGKPDSGYYKDLGHLAEGFNKSDKVKQFIGGELVVNKTGRTAENGDEIYSVGVKGADGQVAPQFEDTTENAMNRFEAQLHPDVRKAVYAGIQSKNASDNEKIEQARKYQSADMATKQALGLQVTAYDKYVDIKKQFPDLDDWQAREAAGIKVDSRYKILSHTLVAMDGDRVGMLAEDRKNPGKIVTVAVPGMKMSDYKKNTKETLEKFTNMHWPVTQGETPEHEVRGKGVFASAFDAEQNPDKQRWMFTEVMPAFRDWLERHSGEVEEPGKDGKPSARRLTTGEMNKQLREIMKGMEGGSGKAEGGKPTEVAQAGNDNNSWGFYLKPSPAGEKKAGETRPSEAADIEEATKNMAPLVRERILKSREEYLKQDQARQQRNAEIEAERARKGQQRRESRMEQKKALMGL